MSDLIDDKLRFYLCKNYLLVNKIEIQLSKFEIKLCNIKIRKQKNNFQDHKFPAYEVKFNFLNEETSVCSYVRLIDLVLIHKKKNK